MKFPTKIDHALAVINLYFTLTLSHWLYEPTEVFEGGVWSPDCVFVFRKKVYVCEVQLTALSKKRWEAKWNHFNAFFNGGHYKKVGFQNIPLFLCITKQPMEIVNSGFDVRSAELIVCREFK